MNNDIRKRYEEYNDRIKEVERNKTFHERKIAEHNETRDQCIKDISYYSGRIAEIRIKTQEIIK